MRDVVRWALTGGDYVVQVICTKRLKNLFQQVNKFWCDLIRYFIESDAGEKAAFIAFQIPMTIEGRSDSVAKGRLRLSKQPCDNLEGRSWQSVLSIKHQEASS